MLSKVQFKSFSLIGTWLQVAPNDHLNNLHQWIAGVLGQRKEHLGLNSKMRRSHIYPSLWLCYSESLHFLFLVTLAITVSSEKQD